MKQSQRELLSSLTSTMESINNLDLENPSESNADSGGQDTTDKMKEILSSLTSMTGTLNNLSDNSGNDSDSETDLSCYPVRYNTIGLGRVVVLEGLQSESGKKLNGCHALVISSKEIDGRWECKVLHRSKTIGLKAGNCKILKQERTVQPPYMNMSMYKLQLHHGPGTILDDQKTSMGMFRNARGICYNDESVFHRARKLVQLLDYPDGEYMPDQTVMLGVVDYFYASVAMLEKDNFAEGCTMYDLEHIACLLSLACMCQGEDTYKYLVGCGDGKQLSECVVFALLEAAPRSLEVLLQFIVMTPYIGPKDDDIDSNLFQRNRKIPALTHAQDNDAYCTVMKGPIGLLGNLLLKAPKVSNRALFQLMQDRFGELFELMLRRLFSFVAREWHGTADGKVLGHYSREILAKMADLDVDGWPSFHFFYLIKCEGPIELNVLGRRWLLADNGIKTYQQLASFLESIVDASVAKRFYDQHN